MKTIYSVNNGHGVLRKQEMQKRLFCELDPSCEHGLRCKHDPQLNVINGINVTMVQTLSMLQTIVFSIL